MVLVLMHPALDRRRVVVVVVRSDPAAPRCGVSSVRGARAGTRERRRWSTTPGACPRPGARSTTATRQPASPAPRPRWPRSPRMAAASLASRSASAVRTSAASRTTSGTCVGRGRRSSSRTTRSSRRGSWTARRFEALQAELLAAGTSPALVHAFHRVWKNFAGFCIRRGYGADLGVLAVKAPRQPHREPAIYSAEDERRIMAAARSPRDRLLVEVLMRTGLRLEEVANLSIDDVVDGPRRGDGARPNLTRPARRK